MRALPAFRAIAAVAVLVISVPAWAGTFTGTVVRIIDGDTVDVLVQQQHQVKQVRVRLADIDAPESGQAFGSRARQALADMVFQQPVSVVEQDTDRYGRILGIVNFERCTADACVAYDANATMVQAGMAWAYRYRDQPTSPRIYAIEQEARSAKRGLWSDPHAQEPWKWRRTSKNATN